jgi:hypothetical protein
MNTPIKTVDVIALEWFDKVNGNSYFAGQVTVNYGMPDVRQYSMPFQYGYGDSYRHEAFKVLEEAGEFSDREKYENGASEPIHIFCTRKGIVTRYTKHENCKQRELKKFNSYHHF